MCACKGEAPAHLGEVDAHAGLGVQEEQLARRAERHPHGDVLVPAAGDATATHMSRVDIAVGR